MKSLFKSLCLTTGVLFYSGICSFGQHYSINGKVTDWRQSLPSTTVVLLDTDSALVKGVIADGMGEFIFEDVKPGTYLISASMVGYAKFFSLPISIKDRNITLPDIILQENVTELGEVVVSEMKQLYSQTPDRLVINLESSITSSGNTLLQVLQKSPGVVVNRQNNSIAMNGKSGVRIMINGKVMQVPPDVMVQMLDGMSASNVEKIELITAPPAEYDAEGNAGIIHIVTRENVQAGTNGSIGLILGAKWAETLGANINLNHRGKNSAYFLDYSLVRDHNLHLMDMNRSTLNDQFIQNVDVHSHRENITIQQNLSAGAEWNIGKNTLLNVLFTGYKRDWDLNAYTEDQNQVAADSTVTTHMNIHESNVWQSATGSIGLQTKLSSKGDISSSIDYLYYHNNNPSQYDNSIFYQEHNIYSFSQIDLTKKTPIRFLVARVDYGHRSSDTFTWEAGIKAVTSTLDNDVLVQKVVDDEWITDAEFSSYSTLHEQIAATYISTKWQAGRQWQVNSGLRYEYTHTVISSPLQKDLVKRKYGYFFPVLSVRKTLDTERDFQFSYTRRITRPTYNDIAPYVFFWGPNTFGAGNTSLYPAIADAVTTGYHVKQWNFSLQFSHIRDEITTIQPVLDIQSNTLTFQSQNLKYLNTLGFTGSWSIAMASWWELQSNLTAQYQVARTSHLENNVSLQLFGLNANMVNQFRLPKNFALELSGMYQSRSLFGISQFLSLGSLNMGVQKSFGEKGTLRLSMDDILYTNVWRINTHSPDNNLDSNLKYDWHNQYIRLTYNRNLGNNKMRTVKVKSGAEEERSRIGN